MDLRSPATDVTIRVAPAASTNAVDSGGSHRASAAAIAAWTVVAADRFEEDLTEIEVAQGCGNWTKLACPAPERSSGRTHLAWAADLVTSARVGPEHPIEVRDLDQRWTLRVFPDAAVACARLQSTDPRLTGRLGAAAVDHLKVAAKHWLEHPSVAPAELPRMGALERARLLHELNSTSVLVDTSVPVHLQVARWAAAHPDAAAVTDAKRSVTYGDLLERADRIGCWLQSRGLGRGDRVGLLCERGIDLVVGALGVLRAGGAFVPLDPAYPTERLAFMLSDSGARLLLTDNLDWDVGPWQGPTLLLSAAPASATELRSTDIGPSDLAYVVYTSGSTGVPKGAMIEHGGLCNLVAWHRRAFDVRPGTRGALAASPAFDPTIQELWPMLVSGASLHVLDAQTRMFPDRLARWLCDERIEQIILPTPLGEALLERGGLETSALQVLMVGGDRLRTRPDPSLPFRFVNFYGPAEATVMTTSHDVLPSHLDPSIPPIGTAIDNTFVAVLDPETLELVPIGNIGELFIGGLGVARGYIGRPELTAERFVELDITGETRRYYRSGDLVRWREDATLEFVGRTDHQVKIRGFRIESGEVEAALRRHPEVSDSVVVACEGENGLELCGFVVARDSESPPSARELRRSLRQSLPQQMVPTRISLVDALPLTANGKVDRALLASEQMLVGAAS